MNPPYHPTQPYPGEQPPRPGRQPGTTDTGQAHGGSTEDGSGSSSTGDGRSGGESPEEPPRRGGDRTTPSGSGDSGSSEGSGGEGSGEEGSGEEGSGEGSGGEGGEPPFEPTMPEGQYQTGDEIIGQLQPPEPGDGSDVKALVESAGLEVMAVDWVFQHIAGKSLVDMVIKPLTGDFSKMRQNGEAWRNIANAMKQFSATMSGNAKIVGEDWKGPSGLAHKAYVDVGWKAGLAVEGEIAKVIAKGFDTVADGSEKLAREALKLLKKLVDKLIEIAAKACIPVVGWAAEATTVIDALDIANQIFQIIELIKDIIEKVKAMWQSIQDIGSQLAKIKDIQSLGDAIDIAKNVKGDVTDISGDAKGIAGDAKDIGQTAREIGASHHGEEPSGEESSSEGSSGEGSESESGPRTPAGAGSGHNGQT
ncbi:hypothetical protein [Amycolatopsis pigmentata]|uniref:WXG100 family type VII secretion target n=1 Tax=Amycolatopsis pigmentata TaxID=450801 RepID=A0ABW5FUI0_9PSEU